jgi:pimeloyl-ACP methyl ester carboxylesterase
MQSAPAANAWRRSPISSSTPPPSPRTTSTKCANGWATRKSIWTGGSYGSLAAQVYLRRHGQHVRAAALGGIVPPDEFHPLHAAWAGQRAVDIIFDKCRADPACHAAYPNLKEEFQSIFARVRQGIEVEVRAPDGRTARVHPGVEALGEGIRHYLYSTDGAAFPQLIHKAAAGDLTPLIQRAVSAEIELANDLAMGMLLSVTCAEQIPYIDDATLARETANTFLGDLRVQEQRAACREWVRAPLPKDVHELVHSQVPVLLISGARDAVTPPQFGDRVAAQLTASRHIIFPESSHGNWGFCGIKLMSDFLEKGSAEALDTSCVSSTKAPKIQSRPLIPRTVPTIDTTHRYCSGSTWRRHSCLQRPHSCGRSDL